jgi:hypothetical protein
MQNFLKRITVQFCQQRESKLQQKYTVDFRYKTPRRDWPKPVLYWG